MRSRDMIFAPVAALLAAACQPAGAPGTGDRAAGPLTAVKSSGPQDAFAAIAADETIRFLGTEPFWDGTVQGTELVYKSLENEAGETVTVERFAGNNGLGFSGTLGGRPLDMTVTPGQCSDGMSDRTFPFTVTLKIGSSLLSGCAWTDRMPYTGPANP